MIGKQIIFKTDSGETLKGEVFDKVLMLGVGQISFLFIKIKTYHPITYYCVRPTKTSFITFIRAKQILNIVT